MASTYPTAVASSRKSNGILSASIGAVASIHLCLMALLLPSPVENLTPAKQVVQSVVFLVESAPTPEVVQPKPSNQPDTQRKLIRHTRKPEQQTAPAQTSPPPHIIAPAISADDALTPAMAPALSPTRPVAIKPATPLASANGSTNLKPEYPKLSRRLGEQGLVRLRLLVLKSGEVAKVEVLQSSGFHRLDLAAAETVRQWHFEPAKQGEQAIDNWQNQTIVFELN